MCYSIFYLVCREMTVVNRLKGCKKGPQLELKWRLRSTVAQAPAAPLDWMAGHLEVTVLLP